MGEIESYQHVNFLERSNEGVEALDKSAGSDASKLTETSEVFLLQKKIC